MKLKKFVICQKHHYGWTKDTHVATNVDDAVKQNVEKYHDFLTEKYEGEYKITHNIGSEDFSSYVVSWNSDTAKSFPLGQSSIYKGDRWFSDRIRLGESDDCSACGGTGINHYNPFVQCYECGDGKSDGRSKGKNVK